MTKPNKAISHALSTMAVILVIVIWQLYAIRIDNSSFMPGPIKVFTALFELLGDGETYKIIFTTLLRLIISIIIASTVGLFLGLVSGIRYQVEALLRPVVSSLRTLPVISIVIVILILYGNAVSLYIISFLLLFPLIYQSELDGIKNIDSTLLEVLKLDCDKCSLPAVKMVFLPLSLPHFRTGILQSAGLGIKVLVVAEFIAQAEISIGKELAFAKAGFEYSYVFAWTIILIVIVVGMEHFIQRYLRYTTK